MYEPQSIPESEFYTGVPADLVRNWIAHKYIIVEEPARGHGSKNKLALHDLYKIKCFAMLVKNNILRKDAKQIVEYFSNYDAQRRYLHVYRTDGDIKAEWFNEIQQTTDGAALLMIIDSRQVVKSINFKIFPATVKIT